MNSSILHLLITLLIFLIFCAAFFSAAEIGLMSLNRYRLRHLVRKRYPAALRVSKLLERPDRLLGLILIGNNFANILASAVATVIAIHLYGDYGVLIATILLTMVILIFAEITPKTLAALHPERIAFLCSGVLKILLFILFPFVWLSNAVSNGILRTFGVKLKRGGLDTISHEELRTIVREATGKAVSHYQDMLISILDLQKIMVEDIMVPRNEIIGINIEENWESILKQLTTSQHTRLPVYSETIEKVRGILHLRHALNLLADNRLDKKTLLEITSEAYFVPESTPLNTQLINFRRERCRSALVVDEYGEILGLITLEDILEEIVGEFTTNLPAARKNILLQKNGSYLVDAGITIRELNRIMKWEFPVAGPKTLSGLIVEYLEALPNKEVCLRLAGYPIEIEEIEENTVKTARIWPKLRQQPRESHE